jgi:hypothetical protein
VKVFVSIFLGAILLLGSLVLSGCLVETTPSVLPPTMEPLPPTLTPQPSPTVIWFPPTPTFTPYPTQVVTPTAEMRPGLGQILLNETFSSTLGWSLASSVDGTTAIDGGELSIVIPQAKAYLYTTRQQPQLDNFYVEVTAGPTLCTGMDEYGLLVRYTSSSNYDRISLTCDGQVRLDRVAAGTASALQTWMISGAFPPGAPALTRLGVWVVGDELRVFINDIYQFSVHDTLNKSGSFGLYARSTGANALSVRFSNLIVRQASR